MQAKHCKFKQQRRIEHHIRILLIREYPFIFAGTHTRPAGDSLTGRISPVIKVADNAAKQTIVCRRNPVMVVQRNSGQCRDINLELLFIRDMRCQFRIQRMNTFQNENRIIFNFQFITFIFLLPQREVKARKLHFLTAQQSLQLLVKQFQIERIQRLIIIVTVFIQRCLFTVYEIIVQGDREGFEPVRHQLDGKTFAERGLS